VGNPPTPDAGASASGGNGSMFAHNQTLLSGGTFARAGTQIVASCKPYRVSLTGSVNFALSPFGGTGAFYLFWAWEAPLVIAHQSIMTSASFSRTYDLRGDNGEAISVGFEIVSGNNRENAGVSVSFQLSPLFPPP
jgi:hypothetical protein